MGKWIPRLEDIPQGVPHLTKFIEYKDTVDESIGILPHLKIQEGTEQDGMKKVLRYVPKSMYVATTLWLTEFLHGKDHVVYGDSYIASLQTTKALLREELILQALH